MGAEFLWVSGSRGLGFCGADDPPREGLRRTGLHYSNFPLDYVTAAHGRLGTGHWALGTRLGWIIAFHYLIYYYRWCICAWVCRMDVFPDWDTLGMG